MIYDPLPYDGVGIYISEDLRTMIISWPERDLIRYVVSMITVFHTVTNAETRNARYFTTFFTGWKPYGGQIVYPPNL